MSTDALLEERKNYKYGFVTDVEMERFPKGLSEEVIRAVSAKKGEPKFLLDFRLKAYADGRRWRSLNGSMSSIPPSIIKISATIPLQNKSIR